MSAEKTEPPPGNRLGLVPALLALLIAALILWAAVFFGAASFVAIAFGGVLGLVGAVLVFAGSVFALAQLTRQATGRRRWGAAVTVTLTAAGCFVVALLHFGTIPMIWLPGPGIELMYPVIGVTAALVLGVFIGPLPLRAVGALAAIGIVVAAVLALTPAEPADDPNAVATSEEQFAAYRELYEAALVVGSPGSAATRFDNLGAPGGISWNVMPSGGVVQVARVAAGPKGEIAELTPCWMLAPPNMVLSSTDSPSDYAEWCIPTADGWARSDGLGLARQSGGVLVVVTAADESAIQAAGGTRAATADEIREALDTLRPVTIQELRAAFDRLPS